MLYMATVSFSGIITMKKGEVREISDQSLVDDLLKAGYIIPYEPTSKKVEKEPKDDVKEDVKPEKKTKRKGKTTNED